MSSIRWIVRPGDGLTVGEIARKAAPRDPAAVDEGRVFIGKRRAKEASEAVKIGEIIDVFRPRLAPNVIPGSKGSNASAASPEATSRILFHEGGLVVAAKPAAIGTVPDHHGSAGTLVHDVARLLSVPLERLRVVSRLDVGVSGVVVFALDEASERALIAARERGAYRRVYVAVAGGVPTPREGLVQAAIGRHDDARKRAIDGVSARAAETRYQVRAEARDHAVIHLEPHTGRTHQLRLHMAHLGAPLLGDRLYGGALRVLDRGAVLVLSRIALHARSVEIPGLLPYLEEPVPAELRRIWSVLGGAPSVWEDLPR